MANPWDNDKGFQEWLNKQPKQAPKVTPTTPVYENPQAKKIYTFSKSTLEEGWRGNYLKNLSKKQYGSSYDDKFSNWVKEKGGSDDDAEGFRYWMNKRQAGLKQTESIQKREESEDFLRQWRLHQQPVTETKVDSVSSGEKEPIKKDKPAKKDKPKKETSGMIKAARKATLEFFNPFDDVSGKEAVEKFLNKKQSDTFKGFSRGANRAVDSASFGLMSNLDKKVNDREPYYNSERKFGEGGGTDMLTSGIGYLVPGVGAYKALNATKAGQALTQLGTKGLSKRLLSEGAKGAITGAATAGAEVGVREALNPKDQNWKDNAAWLGFGTVTGAIADPLMYGGGKLLGKGAEKVAGKAMEKLVPSSQQTADVLSSVMGKGERLKPKEFTMPNGEKVHIKNRVTDALKNTEAKLNEIQPKVDAQNKELQEAIQQQYGYLKNSMTKGVDTGTTGNGMTGNFKEVDGRYTISKNEKWYQDFYAANKRKPTEKELWDIAERQVKEGFQDEAVGEIPAWKPKEVQEIDSQIEEMNNLLRDQPEQEEALRPILEALEEDRQAVIKSIEETQAGASELQKQKATLQRTLNGEDIQPMRVGESLPDDVQAMKSDTIPLREPTGDKQFKDMGFWERAVNKVKKAMGSEKVYEQPITRREILSNMRKNLGVTIRTGRLNADESVKGYFKVNPEVIRSRQHGDIQVISHEIGHSLDKQFKLANEAFDNELMALGANTSGKDYTPEQVRKEGLAEFIRLFLTDSDKAIQQAPLFSKHFDEVLPKRAKNSLLKTQADIDRWIEQGPELRLRGKIDRTGKEQVTLSEKVDKVYSQFVDKFDQLGKIEKAITGKINDATQSLYKKARNSVGAPKKAEMILQDFKKILKPIENYGYNMKDVGDYATAVHALELETMGEKVAIQAGDDLSMLAQNAKELDTDSLLKAIDDFQHEYGVQLDEAQVTSIAKGEELELNEDQLFLIAETNRVESGMTLDEINKTIAKYDAPEMKGIQQEIVGYNNRLLDMLVEGQILTKEAVESMRQKYPNYVPFFRFFDEDISMGLSGGKGFVNVANPVKRLKGSTRDVIDPLESMVKNTFAVVNAVEKNKVGLELSRLADIEGAGQFIERLEGQNPIQGDAIVTVTEKGQKVKYQLNKDLYDAIKQLDEDTTNKVIQFLSYPTSMLRAGATLTPEFMLRNPIRDQFQAFVVSNYGYNPIIDLPLGAWEVFKGKTGFKKSNVYKKWVMNGGGYGNYLSQDRNYLRETLHTLKKEGKWYQKGYRTITNPKELGKVTLRILQALSEFSEEATKVGEFRKAKKKGATEAEAAFQSRDLMDFGRVGSDMRQWNRAVAFLNANIQGKDKIARAFKSNPVRTTTKALVGVTVPALGALLSMEFLANDKQKETYENAPKWMKDTFFLLPIPGTDELARIPKPFDLAPVFANPVEHIWDYVKNNDPDAWDDFLQRQAMEILKIPHMLTGLTPIIENVTNYSFFTGGTIVPRRDQDLLPQDQYGVTTSLTARTVGNLTKTSPYKVDNMIRGYGAGLGKYATAGLDKILEKAGAGELPPQEAKKWSELPVVNAFTVDSTGGGQVMNDFYDTLDKLKKENNSAKRNEVEYERSEEYKYLNKTSSEISKLRNEYRQIQGSYDLSPKEKRIQLDELDSQMNRLAREALISVGEKNE
jgi:hypothetical protein